MLGDVKLLVMFRILISCFGVETFFKFCSYGQWTETMDDIYLEIKKSEKLLVNGTKLQIYRKNEKHLIAILNLKYINIRKFTKQSHSSHFLIKYTNCRTQWSSYGYSNFLFTNWPSLMILSYYYILFVFFSVLHNFFIWI